jgi:hypothetical protein
LAGVRVVAAFLAGAFLATVLFAAVFLAAGVLASFWALSATVPPSSY